MPDWNPEQYEKFIKDRTQPAIDLANRLEVKEKFDMVFSNACIQWIPNHEILLPKLMSLLRRGGVLAVQIPVQSEHPVHIIMNELVTTEKWKDKLSQRNYNNLTTSEYFDVLSGISDDFEVWETIYCHRMPSYESIIEWYKGTGLRPYIIHACATTPDDLINIIIRLIVRTRNAGEFIFVRNDSGSKNRRQIRI